MSKTANLTIWTNESGDNSEYRIASFLSRFIALAIDALIAVPIFIISVNIILGFFGNASEVVTGLLFIISLITSIFLLKVWQQIKRGQSFGQRIMKIALAGEGKRNANAIWTRNAICSVSNLIPFGLQVLGLSTLLASQNRGFHDKLSGTWVVKTGQNL
jgi:uncharacterized RDD family membrane protein YckC